MTIQTEPVLPSIEIELHPPITKSIIWLHGLGADGNDFLPIIKELNFPKTLGLRFIFPNAPTIPVTINNGFQMPAWYDIYSPAIDAYADTDGIARSVNEIEKLIAREEKRGIPASDIILAGFSQGAVIALTTGLCYPKPLAGIMALSGYLPATHEVLKKAEKANHKIPIFLGHGSHDPVVPYALGSLLSAQLQQEGYPVSWHSYPMAHSVCPEEIGDMRVWAQEVLTDSK